MTTNRTASEMSVEEMASGLADVLLGTGDGKEGRLTAAIREQIEPQLAAAIDPISEQMREITAAQEQGPPQGEQAKRYAPPPWASPGAQIAGALGMPDANWHNPDAAGAQLDGQFGSFSEYLRAVIRRDRNGIKDDRLIDVSTSGDVKAALTGEEIELGGALVPEEFRPQLLTLMLQATSIRSRATVLPMGSSSINIPAIRDESHASGNVFGGVRFDWTEVREEATETEPEFKLVNLNARALAGRTSIPNSLIEDSFLSVPQLIMSLWSQAVPWIEEREFIRGDGVGKPLGILNSPARTTVSRDTAATFGVGDMYTMLSRMLPGSLGRAIWMINPEVIPQLGALNSGDVQSWHPALAMGMPDTLNGRPILYNEHMSGLGTAGDVALIDWMYYLIGDRQALSMAASEHEKFSRSLTVLRGTERLDARPWLDTPITPAQRSGSDFVMSPFVVLGDA